MVKAERNSRAVQLWLESHSWRRISSLLAAEGYGAVSHQYISRVVKRELTHVWRRAMVFDQPRVTHEATESSAETATDNAAGKTVTTEDFPRHVKTRPTSAGQTASEIIVESFFNARHFIQVGERVGPPHHHSFRVQLAARGDIDPGSGMMIGFAEAQALLDRALADFSEQFLNSLDAFSKAQPTTENLAVSIADSILPELVENGLHMSRLSLWESPTKGVTISFEHHRVSRASSVSEAGEWPFRLS